MTNAVFHHKPNSAYDDRPDHHYHFPGNYLERVEATIGDRIVYYGDKHYFATAQVVRVRPDSTKQNHYYADVAEYLDFDRFVHYRANGGFEKRLVGSDGKINGGLAINSVRHIEASEFSSIVEAGFSEQPSWPDRNDKPSESDIGGFEEDPPLHITRSISQQLISRPFRDLRFKFNVRSAYDRTCAFTGLRLINGGGRPEVEAAHIVPVEENGSDSVRNGIALSGTVHWMFDRGLLSLSDDFTILISRQLNQDISHLLNADRMAHVPVDSRLQPHPQNLSWHRANRFKI